MLTCTACGSRAALESKFCAQCGALIPLEDAQAAKAEATRQLAEGQRLYAQGRAAEALLIAENLVQGSPDDVAALALLGDCLERTGRIDEALQTYERVVALEPTSALDRIRVSHLRRLAETSEPAAAGPDRRHAAWMALAATVLVMSVGSAIVVGNRQRPTVTTEGLMAEADLPQARPFATPAPVPTKGTAANQTQQPTERSEEQTGTTEQPATGTRRVTPGRAGSMSPGTLPDPARAADRVDDGYRPMNPFNVVPEQLPPAQPPSNDPEPSRVAESRPADPEPPVEREVIDIKPSGNERESVGGSETTDGANEAETLIRVARQQVLAGNYSQAARAYERALRAGASPASTNQRLAQCYEKLGQRGDAVAAYRRALSAYESLIARGVGDSRLLQTQADACRQALRVLGG